MGKLQITDMVVRGWITDDGTQATRYLIQELSENMALQGGVDGLIVFPYVPKVMDDSFEQAVREAFDARDRKIIQEKSSVQTRDEVDKVIHSYWHGVSVRTLKDSLRLPHSLVEGLVTELSLDNTICRIATSPMPGDVDGDIYLGNSTLKRILYSFMVEPISKGKR